MKKVSRSRQETAKIAKIFFNAYIKNKRSKTRALVFGLFGDLGVGKTAFTQEIVKHLGIKNKVNSPTFVIIKKYRVKIGSYKFLFHIDAYRLKNEKELLYLGWDKIIGKKEHIIFIEWPDNVRKIIPAHAKSIYISCTKSNNRRFEF